MKKSGRGLGEIWSLFSFRRCNALLPHEKFLIHSGCLIVHLFEVGVIPCMQLPPLAVVVYVLEKHGLHMLLLSNWEILSLPHHHSIHEDNMHFSVQCSHKPIVQFLSYRWMHHIYGCTYLQESSRPPSLARVMQGRCIWWWRLFGQSAILYYGYVQSM